MVNIKGWVDCTLRSDNTWHTLVNIYVAAEIITPTSTLTLAMSDDHLQFRVNGRLVADTLDDTLTSGNWGLYAETPKTAQAEAIERFREVTIGIASNTYDIGRAHVDMLALASAAR